MESFDGIPYDHDKNYSSFIDHPNLTLREKLKILSDKIKASVDQVRPPTLKTPNPKLTGSITYSKVSLFITPPPSPKRSMLPKPIPLKKPPWHLHKYCK